MTSVTDTDTFVCAMPRFKSARSGAGDNRFVGTEVYALGAPITTTCNGAVSATATTVTLTSATGFPTGATNPYVIAIDDELMLGTLASVTFTVVMRGYMDTP